MIIQTFKLGLDNRVKPGQQTVDELIATFQGLGGFATTTEQIFDPITGEFLGLLLVLISLAAVAGAQDIINANSGVAFQFGCADTLTTLDLNASSPDGLVLSTALLATGQQITCLATDNISARALGTLTSGAGFNAYADALDNFADVFPFTQLIIQSTTGAGLITIPPGDLKLNFGTPSGTSQVVNNIDPITVNGNTSTSVKEFYVIKTTGEVFLKKDLDNGVLLVSDLAFNEATCGALGPV